MACNPAPTCKAALAEATRLWPGRSTASDGICASALHTIQNPDSDHELGNAFDLTTDPSKGCDCAALTAAIVGRKDPRVKYVIFNRKIYGPGSGGGWGGKDYTGKNPHTSHMHVSIYETARDSTIAWFGANGPAVPMDGAAGAILDLPGVDTALDAARAATDPLAALGAGLSFLTDPGNWRRVALFVGGGVLLVAAVLLWVASSKSIRSKVEVATAVATRGAVDLDGPDQ